MNYGYDDWLSQQVEDYMDEMYCEPKVIKGYTDEDGMSQVEYNCEYCDNKECEEWGKYND